MAQSSSFRDSAPKVPKAATLTKMKQEINDKKAYDIRYSPHDPSSKRGRALIIVNSKSNEAVGLAAVDGAQIDLGKLKSLWKYLQFEVSTKENLTAKEIKEACVEERKLGAHRTATVFVFYFLGHGDKEVVYGTDGKAVDVYEELMEPFDGQNCSALLGKPKLFFVEACQGEKIGQGVAMTADAAHTGVKYQFEKADLHLVLSSCPGYATLLDPMKGGTFVQELTTVFEEQAHETHFFNLMAEVKRRMNEQLSIGEIDGTLCKQFMQVCWDGGSLLKKVYLLPY